MPCLTVSEYCADLNRDGFVNFEDVAIVRKQFGKRWEELQQCNRPIPTAVMYVPGKYVDGSEILGEMTIRLFEVSPGCYVATVADSEGIVSEPSEVYCAPTAPE